MSKLVIDEASAFIISSLKCRHLRLIFTLKLHEEDAMCKAVFIWVPIKHGGLSVSFRC